MSELIATEEVTKLYNPGLADETQAVDHVTVDIREGEVAVLRGPSGSGKTSLLSLLGCMSRPTSGRVLVRGRNVAKLPERFLTEVRRKTFGFIFQQFHLIRTLPVMENVLLPLYPTGLSLGEMAERGNRVLERFGITHRQHVKVGKLSGGEQQRVAIARALVNDPEILIADEPTAHLDTELSEVLLSELQALNREGRTVVIATHDPLVFEHPMVNRVISVHDGRVEGVVER